MEKQRATSLRILHGPFSRTAPHQQGDPSINSDSQFKGVGAASNPNGTAPRLPWQRSRAALKQNAGPKTPPDVSKETIQRGDRWVPRAVPLEPPGCRGPAPREDAESTVEAAGGGIPDK